MTPYFKAYLEKAAVGSVVGITIGAACGSVGGIMGLRQMCAGQMEQSTCEQYLKPIMVPDAMGAAASAGASGGASIGFLTGFLIYPIYRKILGWLCPVLERQNQIIPERTMEEMRTEIKIAPIEETARLSRS